MLLSHEMEQFFEQHTDPEDWRDVVRILISFLRHKGHDVVFPISEPERTSLVPTCI